jgi:SAM-dependent methyltransferase
VTDYERETRSAYRTEARAAQYKRYNTTDWSWGRLATRREQAGLRKRVLAYRWLADDVVLDVPCGTGILGPLLSELGCNVVAGDISLEMMQEGRSEYAPSALRGLVQSDITHLPFPARSMAAVFVLGFLHRVPPDLKLATLRSVREVTRRLAFVTSTIDSPAQALKRRLLPMVWRGYKPAPCPISLDEFSRLCAMAGFRMIDSFVVLPGLSAERVFVLERDDTPAGGTHVRP